MTITLTGHMIKALAEHAGLTVRDDSGENGLDYEYTIENGLGKPVREDDNSISVYPYLVIDHDGDESERFPLGDAITNYREEDLPVKADDSNNKESSV